MARPVVVVIHDRQITRMLLPGGEVYDDHWRVTQLGREMARARVPKRSGTLARSIQASRPKLTGPYQGTSQVTANARHAVWVHEGTSTPIVGPMIVPNKPGPVRAANLIPSMRHVRSTVRGQRANPFLNRGISAAFAAYGLR